MSMSVEEDSINVKHINLFLLHLAETKMKCIIGSGVHAMLLLYVVQQISDFHFTIS